MCVPYVSKQVGIWQAASLVQTVFSRKGNNPSNNVGYHIWPYWREYVQSTCARIGYSPALEVPVYLIPQKDEESDDDRQV